MRIFHISLLLLLFIAVASVAQNNSKLEDQQKKVADLERKIAAEEREIEKFQRSRSDTEQRIRRLANQITSRNQLLDESEKQAQLLREEILHADSIALDLSGKLEQTREQYAEMVREAYRNYKHNNYLTYIFASRDFTDIARKITNLRAVSNMRARKLEDITALSEEVREEQRQLNRRKRSLDSVMQSHKHQKERLERDVRDARTSLEQLSQKERTALQRKIAQEQQLDVALDELRKLTIGNKDGASFSSKTSGLRLPIAGGRVKSYKGNEAEIFGAEGAKVTSIYEGKVVEIKQNRITNKYEVYVAHGGYISSYSNMGSVSVSKGQKVARNEVLGSIGSTVNILTFSMEYKINFSIHSPNAKESLKAESFFRR